MPKFGSQTICLLCAFLLSVCFWWQWDRLTTTICNTVFLLAVLCRYALTLHASNDLWTWREHYKINIHKKTTWNPFFLLSHSFATFTFASICWLILTNQNHCSSGLFSFIARKTVNDFFSSLDHIWNRKNRLPFAVLHFCHG